MPVVTDEYRQTVLADAVVAREYEVFHYQLNASNYEAMLDELPDGEWPDALKPYIGKLIADLPSTLSDAQVEEISRYQYRDRLRVLVRTERAEMAKTQLALMVIKAQIPSADLDDVLTAAVGRRTVAMSRG